MILSGRTIREEGIVFPHVERTETVLSCGRKLTHGESFAGYDVRVRERIRLWRGLTVLASTIEYFEIPLDVVGTNVGKSSLARRGIAVLPPPLEPGWKGYLTLELQWKPIWREAWKLWTVIPAGTPVTQIQFHRVDAITEGYTGKYFEQPPWPVKAL